MRLTERVFSCYLSSSFLFTYQSVGVPQYPRAKKPAPPTHLVHAGYHVLVLVHVLGAHQVRDVVVGDVAEVLDVVACKVTEVRGKV